MRSTVERAYVPGTIPYRVPSTVYVTRYIYSTVLYCWRLRTVQVALLLYSTRYVLYVYTYIQYVLSLLTFE